MYTTADIQLSHWSHSQDQAWRRCPLKWYRNSYLGLRPKFDKPVPTVGQVIHAAMAEFYQHDPRDRDLDQLLSGATAAWERVSYRNEDQLARDSETVLNVLKDYWSWYGQDDGIPAALTEFEFRKALVDGVTFDGRADLLFDYEGDSVVLDFKTSKNPLGVLPEIDVQLPRYAWALGARWIGYQGIQIPAPGRATVRFPFERIWKEPAAETIEHAVEDISSVVQDVNRPGRLIYPSWSYGCQFDCDYYMLCRAEHEGGDPGALAEAEFTTRRGV